MELNRPSVSRDTRMLFTIIVIAVGMLWVLARIRFPDRQPTANPVPAIVAQLAPPSAFDDITAAVAQVEPRVQPAIVSIATEPRQKGGAAGTAPAIVGALRFRDDLAVALIPPASLLPGEAVEVARDPASHLTVIRVPGGPAPPLSLWSPRRPEAPRFLLAADASPGGISLRPIFVGSLHLAEHPVWSDRIWMLPSATDLASGTFVFNTDGGLAGLVIHTGDTPAMVPADAVIVVADRLARAGAQARGHVGIAVDRLTPELAAATGAAGGVIVTWVDPAGPAAAQLGVTDIIEKVNAQAVPTLEHWRARSARFTEGQAVTLTVRREGEVMEVPLKAAALAAQPADRQLGLTLRTVRRVGAAIARVEPGSAAVRSGLQEGDILTMIGDVEAPTAAQATREFQSAPPGRAILVAFTREGTHHVVAVTRTW